MGSSLLIQDRMRGPRPSCLMASPAAAMTAGTRRMVRRTGPGVKRRIWAMSRSNALAVDAELVELLASRSSGDAVEEQVDGEDDDDEVVEPADDRDVVGDEVAAEDEVAGGTGRAAPFAVGRHPVVEDERRRRAGRTSGSGSRPAGRRAATRRAEVSRPTPGRPRRFVVELPFAPRLCHPGAVSLDRAARARERGVYQRSTATDRRGRPRPCSP